MSDFEDLTTLEAARSSRKRRADRGRSRLSAPVRGRLIELLATQDRPPMHEVVASLSDFCDRRCQRMPARATLYAFMSHAPTPRFPIAELPPALRRLFHNAAADADVAGPQLVQRAFNAGSMAAISHASSLPWLCLHQADQLRGWRPKSRALLRAVMRFRGIRRRGDV